MQRQNSARLKDRLLHTSAVWQTDRGIDADDGQVRVQSIHLLSSGTKTVEISTGKCLLAIATSTPTCVNNCQVYKNSLRLCKN